MGLAAAIPAVASGVGAIANLFGGGGKTRQVNTMPGDIGGFRQNLISWLMGQGGPGFKGTQTPSLSAMAGPNSDFMKQFIAPYQQLFSTQLNNGLAATKEAAGNLTGSGLTDTLGHYTTQALAQQDATLGQIGLQGAGMELSNQQGNAQRMMQMILGLGTAGVSPGQLAYQPGIGDYLTQFAGALGPGLAWMNAGQPSTNVNFPTPAISPQIPGIPDMSSLMPSLLPYIFGAGSNVSAGGGL